MSKKNSFVLSILKLLSYLGCLIIIANTNNYYLSEIDEIIKPVIYIESLILRCLVITTVLTFAGFNLVKEAIMPNKIKSGLVDKYLSLVFFILGVSSLFLPITISRIIKWFLLSFLLYISYLISIKIYKNNEYNKLIQN